MTTEQERLLEGFTNAYENKDFDSFKSYVDKIEVNEATFEAVESFVRNLLNKDYADDEIDDIVSRVCLLSKHFETNFRFCYFSWEDEGDTDGAIEYNLDFNSFDVLSFRVAATLDGKKKVTEWFNHLFSNEDWVCGIGKIGDHTIEDIHENFDYAATLYDSPCWGNYRGDLPIGLIASECMRFVDDAEKKRMWNTVMAFGDDFKDSTINHNTAKDILRFYQSTGYSCLNEEMLKQAEILTETEGLANTYSLFDVLLKNGYAPAFESLLKICKNYLAVKKTKKVAQECLEYMAELMPQRAAEVDAIIGQKSSVNKKTSGKSKGTGKKSKLKNADRLAKDTGNKFPFITLVIVTVLILCNISLCYYMYGMGVRIAIIAASDLLVSFLFYQYATNNDTPEEYAKRYKAWRNKMAAEGDYAALDGFYADEKGKAEDGCLLFFSILANIFVSLCTLFVF